MTQVGRSLRLASLAVLAAVSATAAVPAPQKIADAVAEANRVSGRSEPLLFSVQLRVGAAAPSAEGVLATHPTGLARLELRNHLGFVERHLLQGDSYRASRDGEIVNDPRPFLPPVFLLQADSGAALTAALDSFGVSSGEVVLGRLERHDCYVFGGRIPSTSPADESLLPSMWVDMESFDPVRIVRADGVAYLMGPIKVFDGIRAPAWIQIEAAGQDTVRLEIQRVERASAPAAAFQSDWLTAPAPDAPAALDD